MMFDKKKAAQIITAKLSEPEKYSQGGAVENVDHSFHGLHAAAEEMINAIHNKNPHDLHKSLRSFLDLHTQAEPADQPDGSEITENEEAKEHFYKNKNG